jgi:hypothetical protein
VLDDYAQVTARAFDEPYVDDLRALVRVCGDHFEQHGDPRGTLIALGEAHYDTRGKRAHELQYEIDQHVLVHHEAELGPLAPFVRKPRTCVLEWRCGQLYSAWLDTRHLHPNEFTDAVEAVLGAPASKTLRRLTIRVRQDQNATSVGHLIRASWPKPQQLEHISILREVRPRRHGGRAPIELAKANERLYFYAQGDAIYGLPLDFDGPRAITELNTLATPLDQSDRIFLGRALTHHEPAFREAAIDKIAEHAGAQEVDLIALLLRPGMLGVAPLPLLACLRAMGTAARRALPVLVQIPGRTHHYDVETRRAAGKLIASLREP